MASLSSSMVSMFNATNLGLVNVNVDVSLVRCDPAQEFLAVGSALTKQRRQEAETGEIHKTAS